MEEKNAFLDVLGYSPQARIIDILITGRRLEYSATGIIQGADVGRATFYKIFPQLLKQGLIVQTKKIGNIQLYAINQKNSIVQYLIKLHNKILEVVLEKRKLGEIKTLEEEKLVA